MRNLNKFTKFFTALPIILISQLALSDPSPVLDSVITVDKMLKRDNFYAKQSADATEALFVIPTTPNQLSNTDIKISKITAIDNKYKISLSFNGSQYNNATIGTKIDKCTIVSVQERCVVLSPIKKSTKQSFCPTSCWTGISNSPITNTFQPTNVINALPMPAALPSLSFNKLPSQQSESSTLKK